MPLYCWKGSLRRALYTDTASQQGTRLTDWVPIIPEERPRSFSLFIQGNNEPKWVQAAVDKHVEKCQYKLVGTVPSKLLNKNFWTQLTQILRLQKRPRQKNDNHAHQEGSWNDNKNFALPCALKCKIPTFGVLVWTSFPFFSGLNVW